MTFRRRASCAFLCAFLLAGCAVRQRTHEEDTGSAVKELALLPYDITKGVAGLSWFIAYNMYKYAPKVACVFTQLGLKLTGKGLADGMIYGVKGLGYDTYKGTILAGSAAWQGMKLFAKLLYNTPEYFWTRGRLAAKETAKGTMYVAQKTSEVTYDVTKGAILLVPTVSKMALEDCFTPKSESLCRRLIVTILMK